MHAGDTALRPLREAYADLRAARPHLRARDAAAALTATEAALVASGALGDATPLGTDWMALLNALPSMGRLMALTRNEHAVHERLGVYRGIEGSKHAVVVLGPEIDLRLFPRTWAHAYALRGERPSIQIFAEDGSAAHKIYATEATDMAVWDAAIVRLAGGGQAPLATPPTRLAVRENEVDASSLRADWRAMRDTHDFFGLLRRHGAGRGQAFRLAGDEFAVRLAPEAGAQALRRAASAGVPVMVFVGNAHAIQIHTGPVHRLVEGQGWFNVLDPDFNLHLREAGVAEAWRVVKPTRDGTVTSIELLDAAGETIAMLFGARKPGQPELPEWRELARELAESHVVPC